MESDMALLRLKNSRQKLLKEIEDLSEWERCNVQVEGIWTVKDLLGHICAWEASLCHPLRLFLQAGEFTPENIPDHDAWNAHQAEIRVGNDFAEALAEAEVTRDKLEYLATQISPADWERSFLAPWGGYETLSQMVDGLAWHEEEHTRCIEAYKLK